MQGLNYNLKSLLESLVSQLKLIGECESLHLGGALWYIEKSPERLQKTKVIFIGLLILGVYKLDLIIKLKMNTNSFDFGLEFEDINLDSDYPVPLPLAHDLIPDDLFQCASPLEFLSFK